MEGVTEPCFRDAVLERHDPRDLGGAFTEYVRVSHRPIPQEKLAEHLGPRRFPQPVGLQIMGSQPGPIAETADAAILAGAPLVDLNFGCPAKGAYVDCAGSALLDYPERVQEFVRVCVEAAAGRVPVTAKMRSGIRDDSRLEEVARAAEAGGAAMITVHCRTRDEGYQDCADWRRVARVVAAVRVPVCGNGSVRSHADLERMRRETGCAYVMVGRAALADPWIFSGRQVGAAEAARFLLDYAEHLRVRKNYHAKGIIGRIRQLLGYWKAGNLLKYPDGSLSRKAAKNRWISERNPEVVLEWLNQAAADVEVPRTANSATECAPS